MALAHGDVAFGRRVSPRLLAEGPVDRNRIAFHRGKLAAARNGECLAVDARFEHAIHRVDEVVAVKLGVKSEDAAAKHSLEQFHPPRADCKCLGIGPRDVPEGHDRCVGQPLADELRQERKVVILDEHDRVVGLGFVHYRLREQPVDLLVVLPVAAAKHGPHVRDVAQRPQALVGKTAVVAGFLLFRQPYATDRIRGCRRRDRHAIVLVDHLGVARAAAVGDPRSRAGAHDRLQRGDKSARRAPHIDAAVVLDVDVGLAVRDDEDVVAPQISLQDGAQRLRRPCELRLVLRPRLALDLAE